MISNNEKERRRKISQNLKKYYSTIEGKKNKIKASTGKKHSEETKQKLSQLKKGPKNGMYKKNHTKEAKKKISKSMIGRKITWGHKISETKKEKTKISQKQKNQISKTLKQYYKNKPGTFKGKKHTEKSKLKMRQANLNKFDGPNHPQWRGGIANFPYCFSWPEISEAIKERDDKKCQNPNCPNNSKRLVSHHINYIKQHCDPDNLITLCISCNSKANFNRKFHQTFYQKIINKRFKGKSFIRRR